MEIELKTKDGKKVTFYTIDYVSPYISKSKDEDFTEVSSGNEKFIIDENYYVLKNKIRETNIAEISTASNL